MIGLWIGAQAAWATAWVLETDRPGPLRRALRAARRAEVTRVVAYGEHSACVEVDDPSLRARNRVERRLRGPVDTREDCDWGRFPEGTGWVAVVIEPPAEGLLPALEALSWPYYDLQVPSDGAIRLCASQVVAGDREALAAFLAEQGLSVRGVRYVGACRREP